MTGLEMKYFVLKPSGNDAYGRASRAAMRRYADSIEHENSTLAEDLREWVHHATAQAKAEGNERLTDQLAEARAILDDVAYSNISPEALSNRAADYLEALKGQD